LEFRYTLPDRIRRRDVVVPEEEREGSPVHGAAPTWVSPHRLELGREHKCRLDPAEVQRLLADPITGEVQRALRTVPHRDREHPVKALERAPHAPRGDRRDHDLSIRATTPGGSPSARLQLAPDSFVVIDLTVEGEYPPAT
jgi:hypothetical protein